MDDENCRRIPFRDEEIFDLSGPLLIQSAGLSAGLLLDRLQIIGQFSSDRPDLQHMD